MIHVRKSNERGHIQHGWLDTYHTFSFADYYDPKHMGFRVLRVINDDRVAPNQGFGMHGHRDMEIITYVLEGALAHRDSMGTGSTIQPGDVQRMSAGTGVEHSEFNPSLEKAVHLLQIWILPKDRGTAPSYEQKVFPLAEKKNRLRLLISPGGEEGALRIGQEAKLFASVLDPGRDVDYAYGNGRYGWIQVARGAIEVNGNRLSVGDGAAIEHEPSVKVTATEGAELLLFDLP